MKLRWSLFGLLMLTVAVGWSTQINDAFADETDRPWVSKVTSVQGRVAVQRLGDDQWQSVKLNDTLFAGDRVRVEANSRAGILLSNDATLRLDQNTTLVFTEIEKETTFIFKLLKGVANFFSRRPRSLKVVTPFVNGVVEGTEFLVQVDDTQTRIDLFEGRIRAENSYGEVQLAKGQGAVAVSGSAPQRRILVKPRDSVQWALYYPPVLALGPQDVPDKLGTSLERFNQGHTQDAIEDLETVEESSRDARFFAYRAALLLQLGRVDNAREDIQQALAAAPDNGEALALEAIIHVVQNRKDDALATAQNAVQADPRSAAAQLALSYARQSGFDLTGALDAVHAAVTHAPENGTAWARLAELQLSAGKLDQGVKSARKAVQLNPNVSHAHTMLGFAYLTKIKINKAREAFEQAITLDSAAPLPRLGLGLAKIRRGHLEQGRSEIEIAVSLDPVNTLMRSYLGKAYFDEKRDPLDEKQLAIAKTMDPNDPTPWLYDAIRKQSVNRPVEALGDLQKSIELNDNRAIYRSRLQLDEDLATRSASLGRIYSDLDFQHLALLEGYISLNADSTNYSAHRLLADTYAAKPRHELARVSELLQAQLFQSINLTPVQAHLADSETAFFEGAGPAEMSFNEFNPLFTRDQVTLQTSAIGATNKTWGTEITGSGVFDRISTSISQFNFKTDGFRDNNDQSEDIVNLFVQGRLTHRTDLQAEYRYSESERGDLSQNFDGLFSADQRDKEDAITTRIGAHHRFSNNMEMIASYIHANYWFERDRVHVMWPSTLKRKNVSDLYEIRTDFNWNNFGMVVGFNYLDGVRKEDWRFFPVPGITVPLDVFENKILKENAFVYSKLNLMKKADLTLGFSGSSMKRGTQIDKKQFNPKFGLTLRPSFNTTLRLAGFRVLSGRYEFVQTIEPTEVSGFSQFFDDPNASDVRSFGAAIDHKFSKRLFGGIEYLRRDLDVPLFIGSSGDNAVYFDWHEYTGLAYLYWAPCDVAALRAEYQYEHFERREHTLGLGMVDVKTHRIPLSISYFHPSGFSLKLVGTYYFQEGDFETTGSTTVFSDSDNFWVFDAEAFYRLPKRMGKISIGIKNLLDEEFNYHDTDPSNPSVVPGFYGFGKISLSF